MNESAYMKAVYDRLGKVGDRGMKVLNTGWLDSYFGGADARKEVMLNRIGNQRDYANKRLGLAETSQKNQQDYRMGNLGVRQGEAALASRDALTGDTLTGLSTPISYYEGRKEAKRVGDLTNSQVELNRKLSGLLGGYK